MTIDEFINGEVCWHKVIVPGDEDHAPVTLGNTRDIFRDYFDRPEGIDCKRMESAWLHLLSCFTPKEIREILEALEKLAVHSLLPPKGECYEEETLGKYLKTDMERYGIDEDRYRILFPDPSGSDDEPECYFSGISEHEARHMHVFDGHCGLDKLPVIEQEASWLASFHLMLHNEIADHLKVTEAEVKEWLRRIDRDCQPEPAHHGPYGEDIPF